MDEKLIEEWFNHFKNGRTAYERSGIIKEAQAVLSEREFGELLDLCIAWLDIKNAID